MIDNNSEIARMIGDPNVAQIDQSQAEAIDALRAADAWLLFTIDKQADAIEAFSVCSFLELLACAGAMNDVIQAQAELVGEALS